MSAGFYEGFGQTKGVKINEKDALIKELGNKGVKFNIIPKDNTVNVKSLTFAK